MNTLLFGLLAAVWGGSYVAIKYVVTDSPPVFGAFLRVAVALVALTAILRVQGAPLSVSAPLRRKMWLAGFFSQGLPFLLLFWGETRITPGVTGIINGTVPLWTFFLLLGLGREHLSARKAAGLLLGFAGIVVVCSPVFYFSGSREEAYGAVAIILMTLCYAIASYLTREILSGDSKADFRANAFHQNCAGVVFLLLASLALEPWSLSLFHLTPAALTATLYLGIISTALAFLAFFHLIREWGAVRASSVTYLSPVMALLWDFVFFHRAPGPYELAGIALILAGVLVLR